MRGIATLAVVVQHLIETAVESAPVLSRGTKSMLDMLPLSGVVYRWLEQPMIRFGRSLTRRWLPQPI